MIGGCRIQPTGGRSVKGLAHVWTIGGQTVWVIGGKIDLQLVQGLFCSGLGVF